MLLLKLPEILIYSLWLARIWIEMLTGKLSNGSLRMKGARYLKEFMAETLCLLFARRAEFQFWKFCQTFVKVRRRRVIFLVGGWVVSHRTYTRIIMQMMLWFYTSWVSRS